ncbi:hypothetical protein AB1Y20_010762 [Prymnesium parvum]|uniref:EF-hand domain-containing protein n=1 Tax=Prymnesium parvum TaxID=97485 RepID=A0AB34ISF1_PRYPA
MVSKYNKTFEVPKEFPSILKAFTREVLRNQPENIYEFGAAYFSEVISQRAEAEAQQTSNVRRLSPSELEELLRRMFYQADKDGSGTLSVSEFKDVLKMADLGLTASEMKRVMAEADVNNDGEITYAEFVPLAVDLVMALYARVEKDEEMDNEEREAHSAAQDFMLHGMGKDELESVMREVFLKADADGSGALSMTEFHKCIREADLGLTRKEINRLMQEVDVDRDGIVTYDEFVPLCFDMLVELLKDELLDTKKPSELEEYLTSLFADADREETGLLGMHELRDLLRSADLGLTRLQIHTILAEAEYDDDGVADYLKFVPAAAKMIYSMLDVESQLERRQAIQMLTEQYTYNGKSAEDVEAALTEVFAAADPEGSGLLPYATMRNCLENSGIGLTGKEVMAILSTVTEDTPYRDIAAFAFKILQSVNTTGMR